MELLTFLYLVAVRVADGFAWFWGGLVPLYFEERFEFSLDPLRRITSVHVVFRSRLRSTQ